MSDFFYNAFIVVVLGLFGLVVASVFLIPFLSIWWGTQEPGTGQHTGYITATETGGIFWQTNRVYFKTDNQSSQEDTYCVKDPYLFSLLKEKQEARELVTIRFEGQLFVSKAECRSEPATITSVSNYVP